MRYYLNKIGGASHAGLFMENTVEAVATFLCALVFLLNILANRFCELTSRLNNLDATGAIVPSGCV
jgi:hypothetical protein